MINYKTTITKENIMNKLKKIGLSALAGSLVATSAFAGEMAVGGSAKATWTDNGSDTSTGSGIGMNKLLTFTGSGEMDNGHNIKVYFGNNGTSQSSASMTYDMGDMGALTLDNGVEFSIIAGKEAYSSKNFGVKESDFITFEVAIYGKDGDMIGDPIGWQNRKDIDKLIIEQETKK